MRGRLVFPFVVELAQLDTDATKEDPDGTLSDSALDPITSGYDDIYREPISIKRDQDNDGAPDEGDTVGEIHRVDSCIRLPAQIHPEAFEQLQQFMTGANKNAIFELWFHYRNLEDLDLIDLDTGRPLININDRLAAIYDCEGNLVEKIPAPPGLYVTQVQSRGFSFGQSRNLLVVTFQEREQGTRITA